MCQHANPALMSGVRKILPGDERHLTERESAQLTTFALSVRRTSGAARLLARTLLAKGGGPLGWSLIKADRGAPLWPVGFVGSIAHDAEFTAVTVVPAHSMQSVGIDIEPAVALPAELVPIVASAREIQEAGGDLLRLKAVFCIKEAVYKATNVLDGLFLDFRDVEVFAGRNEALVQGARTVKFRATMTPRIVVLAWVA